MSGLAVFGLKYPSLLQFDRDARTDEVVRANLRALYAIEQGVGRRVNIRARIQHNGATPR